MWGSKLKNWCACACIVATLRYFESLPTSRLIVAQMCQIWYRQTMHTCVYEATQRALQLSIHSCLNTWLQKCRKKTVVWHSFFSFPCVMLVHPYLNQIYTYGRTIIWKKIDMDNNIQVYTKRRKENYAVVHKWLLQTMTTYICTMGQL